MLRNISGLPGNRGGQKIADATVSRLSRYYQTLKHLESSDIETISSEELASWLLPTIGKYMPDSYIFAIPDVADLPPSLAEKSASDGIRAYVCEGMQCSPPISSPGKWAALIEDKKADLRSDR